MVCANRDYYICWAFFYPRQWRGLLVKTGQPQTLSLEELTEVYVDSPSSNEHISEFYRRHHSFEILLGFDSS